jgi:inorganic phosphate transporter, PiT family
MIDAAIFSATLLLAYANGANDNFKGVATLYGSGVLSYRVAKMLSTAATILGALSAVLVATQLAKAFSGRGLVADSVVAQPAFATAVAVAAGLTVLLATRIGMPISTTHALVGGLAGAGWMAANDALNSSALLSQFVAPLVMGPIIAVAVAALFNLISRRYWAAPRADESCACVSVGVGEGVGGLRPSAAGAGYASPIASTRIQLDVGHINDPVCDISGGTSGNASNTIVVTESRLVNALHVVSGALVCFARGLNDAPKIAGLLLVVGALGGTVSTSAVALAMALGGWLHSRRVAETMSHKISALEPRSSFLANICTAGLVIGATKLGLPLSTTHVSVGAITGVSLVSRGSGSSALSYATLKYIGLAWVFTLPTSAIIACAAYPALSLLFK